MKLKLYIIIGIVILSLIGVISYQDHQIKKERAEKETYQKNTNILLDSVKVYKANDSLSAASVGVLELKLSEYKQHRQEDLNTIKSLNVDINRLNSVLKTQAETITNLEGIAKDTMIPGPKIVDRPIEKNQVKAKCIKDSNKWYSIDLCIFENNKYIGTFINREELIAVNHIIPKKFLFFKWGVKDVRTEIVSKNPNTVIVDVESTIFRK